jgi:hypothetical protein
MDEKEIISSVEDFKCVSLKWGKTTMIKTMQ